MADDVENDDNWLYGENSDALPQDDSAKPANQEEEKPSEPQENGTTNEEQQKESGEQDNEANQEQENGDKNEDTNKQNGEAEGSEKEEGDYDEDSDDDVNVVIGDIKTTPAYTSLNIKRGGLLTSTAKGEKIQQPPQTGKFSVEEFDQPGMINGVPAVEYNLDSLEDKPWRKPGADITDYFNYGFNEDTWRAYCERQKRMRLNESGTGLVPLNSIGMPRGPVTILNDNSKYSGNYTGVRKAGPPPGRRMTGAIDVIGGASTRVTTSLNKMEPPKENVIQVMTADRREYSRKPGFPDMSVPPPPATGSFDDFQPEFGFNPEPEPFYGGYEPTQDSQWGAEANPAWQPSEIKALTPGPPGPAPIVPAPIPPVNMGPPSIPISMPMPAGKDGSPIRSRSRERTRDREASRHRDRDKSRDRDRERSHRRDRSRSRSRRHKSRSRSPGRRSHRKKKSRRHEDSD